MNQKVLGTKKFYDPKSMEPASVAVEVEVEAEAELGNIVVLEFLVVCLVRVKIMILCLETSVYIIGRFILIRSHQNNSSPHFSM